jgi:hypothetical protein
MSSKIEQQVMASVGIIHTARRAVSATALKVYALVASVYALGILVWVARVEQNFNEAFHGGVDKVFAYLLAAVSHTTLAVQLVLVIATLALISLAIDLARSLTSRQLSF